MRDSQPDHDHRRSTQVEAPDADASAEMTPRERMSDTLMSPSPHRVGEPEPELPPASDALPASELGNYRLLQFIGGGGMGQVFLAEHKQLGRKVALKVLRRELGHTADIVQRFVAEAQLVNQIKNEHIVDIHDFGEGPGGLEYFVMELLVGRDLAQARDMDGPFGLRRSLDIVRQVGSALAAVHERKIIHRDLKPENIYLIEKGGQKDFVKLLDFGLAKLTEGASVRTVGTAIGTLLGTPLYMSPEQAIGLPTDWRTDIFSLGLVLHWMLFDQIPHESGAPEEIRLRRAGEPLPPIPAQTSRGELVPPAVLSVLSGCLERDARKRIQSVEEVLKRLPLPPAAPLPAPARPNVSSPHVARSNLGARLPVVGAAASAPRRAAASPPEAAKGGGRTLLMLGIGAGVVAAGLVAWFLMRPAPELPPPEPAAAQVAEPIPPPALPPVPVAVPAPAPHPAEHAPVASPARPAAAPAEAPAPHRRPKPARRQAGAGGAPGDTSSLIDPFEQQ